VILSRANQLDSFCSLIVGQLRALMDAMYVSVPVLFNRSFSKESPVHNYTVRIIVARLDGTFAETRLSNQEPYQ
jgi:hypothetical protein